MRVSLPLIPGYNDSEENISATAEFALAGSGHIDINPLHKLGADKYTYPGSSLPTMPTVRWISRR